MNHIATYTSLPDAARLAGIRRGIEKEGLRVLLNGALALTPHPAALGSAFTHPHITTDFSESQLELITGAPLKVEDCLNELRRVHHYVMRTLQAQAEPELMWASSMPCRLPTDETIPLGRYGSSHAGRAKSIYRMGLGHRYGRRMQTISGIHYNWSLPGVDNDGYFALIRNFRRNAFVLLYLFGASPALSPCFVEGRNHALEPMGTEGKALYLPHATSLRMGRLGYQSDAQASINVSYNGLQGYANSLYEALTQPYPAYQLVGVRNPGGDYNQLGTSLLQIENEFYGTIRPKRTTRSGERPLHALRERGVEYVEVRLMDVNPYEDVGISESTVRMLDVFLLHCLLQESPPDSPEEIQALKHNQHLVAESGRRPGLKLVRDGREVEMLSWADEVLQQCRPIAQALDQVHGTQDYSQALAKAVACVHDSDSTPSAKVLHDLTENFGHNFNAFGLARSQWAQNQLLQQPWAHADELQFAQWAEESVVAQAAIEAADQGSFEDWRQHYMAPTQLG